MAENRKLGAGFTVRLEPELRDAVDARAEPLGLNRNDLITALLRAFVGGEITVVPRDPIVHGSIPANR